MVTKFILPALLISAMSLQAETFEDFNSRKGVPIQNLRSQLQSSCWTFHNFDINQNGWNPGLEGDGAMVANSSAISQSNSGIYTPVLEVGSTISVSFDYTFSEDFAVSSQRWMKICLADVNNEIVQVLEKVDYNGAHAKLHKRYSTEFKNIQPGAYRLVLLYGGNGEAARIAIDELKVSAHYKYDGGCSASPVIFKAKVTGRPDRTAFGNLLIDDNGNAQSKMNAYLVKGSVDGEVKLNADGTFIFAPRNGFEGTSTTFIYKVCDNDGGNLCSANTTVNIDFPNASTSLIDFKGAYKYNGNVELMWNTAAGNNISKFELQRSLNGRDWEKAGIVSKQDDVNVYAYVDNVGKGTAHRRDLYYRLKQTNADGNTLMSRLLIVRVYNTKTLTMISVTPNPLKNDITANVQLLENSYVSMRILNSAGESVLHRLVEGTQGLNSFAVQGSSKLAPGSYILELIVNANERMLVRLEKE